MTVASKVKQTLASLKGTQATLRVYSDQSQDEEAIKIFQDAVNITNSVVIDLENRLKVIEYQEPQYKGN
jgi:acetone carboxylase gamma subunit